MRARSACPIKTQPSSELPLLQAEQSQQERGAVFAIWKFGKRELCSQSHPNRPDRWAPRTPFILSFDGAIRCKEHEKYLTEKTTLFLGANEIPRKD